MLRLNNLIKVKPKNTLKNQKNNVFTFFTDFIFFLSK